MQPEIFDNVLPDPAAYRAAALAQPFTSVTFGPVTFHGIAPAPDTQLLEWLQMKAGGDFGPVMTFLRLSPAGQVEPHFIHDDADMGAWTAILYLNPTPAPGDGTTFYRPRRDGADWADVTAWEPWQTVEAKCNRLVRFPAAWAHSRALIDNYGATATAARLIQVVFGGSKWL